MSGYEELLDRLWAPWRIQYIRRPEGEEGGCFFCRCLAAPPAEDERNLVVWRGQRAFALMNRYPYTSGHLLVAPHPHEGDLARVPADFLVETMQGLQLLVRALERVMQPAGYNVGLNLGRVAGAGVGDHLHWHLVPRWVGDTSFMPVLTGTSVIVQALEEQTRLLRRAVAELGP